MWDVIWHAISPTVGIVLGYAVSRLVGAERWKQIRNVALGILSDPAKPEVDTGRKAVEAALIQSQLDRVYVEAQRVDEAFKNGASTAK